MGEELRGDRPLDHVSTLVFGPCAAPRVELKLSSYVIPLDATTTPVYFRD